MKILKYSLMIAVVTVASYTAYSSQSVLNMSDVTLENVNALASNEDHGGGYCTMHIKCFNSSGSHTGLYRSISYWGDTCKGFYHEHGCSSCNG